MSLNSFPVRASRYLITNWEFNAHDEGITVLIGSDNLVFDESAIELATINADSVVHYLPTRYTRKRSIAKYFRTSHQKSR